MITILNRRELIITNLMEEQARFRTVLSENGIDYAVKTISRASASVLSPVGDRARRNAAADCQYIFFVQKKDYDKAKYLISNNL